MSLRAATDLGAFTSDGFAPPVIAQLAGELEAALPEVLRPHSLLMFWGFKHDTVRTRAYHGIKPHADTAAVNLNFCTSAATRTPVFPWSFHPHSDRPAFASVRRQG